MQPNQILAADLLDILFDGKNKAYGAYQLRRNYNKRMLQSMLSTLLLAAIPIGIYFTTTEKKVTSPFINISELINIPPAIVPPETLPEKEMKKSKPVKTIAATVIAIVPDKDLREENRPPAQSDITDDVKIGLSNVDGGSSAAIGPPGDKTGSSNGSGVSEGRSGGQGEGESAAFIPIEIESEYPGGAKAWARFLNKMLGNSYPPEAYENGIQGTVLIQFIIDIDGTVSNIEAISGPEELRAAAINTIKKSGKWNPAIQNRIKVKTWKRQPITFVLNGG